MIKHYYYNILYNIVLTLFDAMIYYCLGYKDHVISRVFYLFRRPINLLLTLNKI